MSHVQRDRESRRLPSTARNELAGGEAVALALEALGVDTVFTIPSAHNLAILKAIHLWTAITVVSCRHEQGVVHAADGYARTAGKLGVGIVSTGPGTANAMGGLFEAQFASSPVLLITSQIESRYLGRGHGYVHEADQQARMLSTLCREVVTVEHADQITETIIRLGRSAVRDRPRPVAVEIPTDLQESSALTNARQVSAAAVPIARRQPPPESIDHAVALLESARRPLIWAGGGVIRSRAEDALLRVAERWQAPVLTSREGRGSIPENHPLSLGGVAIAGDVPDYIGSCDAVLAVGTRFQHYPTATWTLPFSKNLVHLDVDQSVIGRNYPVAAAIVADAEAGLRALHAALPEPAGEELVARKEHLEIGRAAVSRARGLLTDRAGPDQLAICESIKRHRPVESVVVRDATVPAYVWGEGLLPILRARTSIRSTAAGIGPGLPLAIGAALAADQHVVLLQGDGGFMLSVGELATAVQLQAPVVICLFNDRGYQMLRNIESRIDDGMQHDVDLATPDFAALAEAFGAKGTRVCSAAAFDAAFVDALGVQGPTLIEIDMSALLPMKPQN
ncbi:thiamine pyrophosphate-binding protein [Saccharopolyspora sp. NPDC002686]|uniref:thiamine pyrophosphate-binding protein n=1 Tax=Saccharopolyspora sp. NPDC002686 TaxID=3154541 RepID=UPI00331776AE